MGRQKLLQRSSTCSQDGHLGLRGVDRRSFKLSRAVAEIAALLQAAAGQLLPYRDQANLCPHGLKARPVRIVSVWRARGAETRNPSKQVPSTATRQANVSSRGRGSQMLYARFGTGFRGVKTLHFSSSESEIEKARCMQLQSPKARPHCSAICTSEVFFRAKTICPSAQAVLLSDAGSLKGSHTGNAGRTRPSMYRLGQSLAQKIRPFRAFRIISDSFAARPGGLLPLTATCAKRESSSLMASAMSTPEYMRPGMSFQPHYTDLQLDRAAILRYWWRNLRILWGRVRGSEACCFCAASIVHMQLSACILVHVSCCVMANDQNDAMGVK